jgi:hypothetical protein
VILVHGYSDHGESFTAWKEKLVARGFNADVIDVITYESLTNEVTIKDLAEGFDRAIRTHSKLKEATEFDVIVHSTGMLVVRTWLVAEHAKASERLSRIKHLIGFAPATFGSPLAHKGRGVLGALFKGNKRRGPDFLAAGDLILDALELGSRYTWDLANADLFGQEKTFYGEDNTTPYPFIFCGNRPYDGIVGLINEKGTDGTVRWAGASLNSRKIVLDLTPNAPKRLDEATWTNVDCPVMFTDDQDHGSILSEPAEDMVEYVVRALLVDSHASFTEWVSDAGSWSRPPNEEWQQFVIRVIDQRGDPVPDYSIRLFQEGEKEDPGKERLTQFVTDVDAYSGDKSFRCFHVNLNVLKPEALESLYAVITISSGSIWVSYEGRSDEGPFLSKLEEETEIRNDENDDNKAARSLRDALQPAETVIQVDLSAYVGRASKPVKFFYGFTTTLIEIKVNREPVPVGNVAAKVCRFI